MRAVEIERLNFLRAKAKTPEGLNEKETERLRGLESKEFTEKSKGGSVNGSIEQSGADSGKSVKADTRDVDNSTSGKVSRKGARNERADGNESDSIARGTGGASGGPTRPNGNSNRGIGAESDEPRESDSGNSGADRDNDGADGDRPTGDGSGRSVGDSSEEKSGTQRVSNLSPKKDIKPKKKALTQKKKKEVDADMIGGLLLSGFSLIAKTTGRKHWEITEDEAESVAEPMEYLLDNMTAKQKKAIEKYSNPIMLASAVAGIVVPRLMVDIAMMKVQSTKAKGGAVNVRSERTIETNIDGGIISNFGVGTVQDPRRDTEASKVATPVNDPIVAGLFSKGD
jgi:hypothetical protein